MSKAECGCSMPPLQGQLQESVNVKISTLVDKNWRWVIGDWKEVVVGWKTRLPLGWLEVIEH